MPATGPSRMDVRPADLLTKVKESMVWSLRPGHPPTPQALTGREARKLAIDFGIARKSHGPQRLTMTPPPVINFQMVGVAQLGSATALGAVGRRSNPHTFTNGSLWVADSKRLPTFGVIT